MNNPEYQRMRGEKHSMAGMGGSAAKATLLARLQSFGWFKLLALMLGLGIVLMFACIHWVPDLVRWGIPKPMADRIPFAAFFFGLAWGFAVAISEEPKLVLQGMATILGLGALFWFGGLLIGGLLVAMGVPEKKADLAPAVAFYLGLFTGLVAVLVHVSERLNMPRMTNVLVRVMAIPLALVVVAFIVFEFVAGALFALAYIDLFLIAAAIVAAIFGVMIVLGKVIDMRARGRNGARP